LTDAPAGSQRPASASGRYTHLAGDGTGFILAGSLVAGVGAYVYQFLGGRSLGAEAFAPVSVLLTLHFLVFVVVLLPVEQLIVRRLTLNSSHTSVPRRVWGLVGAAGMAAVAYTWWGVDSLFRGDLRFVGFLAATVATHTLFVVARGLLAGRRRFRAYGLSSAAASLLRLAIAAAVLEVRPTASGFALGLVLGPLVVLLWRPGRTGNASHRPLAPAEVARLDDRWLLTGLVLSSAASQLLLLSGPLLLAAIGGGEAAVSVAFATFTLSRAPLTFGYNLLARILPPFTEMAARGERQELRAWGRGIGFAALGLGLVAAAIGWAVGPWIVAAAFGPDFRPTAGAAALIAVGVVFAGAGLFVGQVLVARGEPVRLAAAWLIGLVVGGLVLALSSGDPLSRVSASFVSGEAGALAALLASAVAVPGTTRRGFELAKRSIDIGVAVFLLIVTSPVLLLGAVLVKLDSAGPAFFRQERIGRNGERFALLKLRTMRAAPDEAVFESHLHQLESAANEPEALRIDDDPRVTRVGRVLRATSIDEIPNLWNVLGGSMSLVGPRPLVGAEAELIGLDHPRFHVKPGVTGLAQISGRNEISLAQRSNLDAVYVASRSIRSDLAILARTVATVIRSRG
jgi:lipopolysaccharide/colanic/teichoic acid biosynthesis glycosyltransferase